MAKRSTWDVPLPRGWRKRVCSAVIHTFSLAATAMTATRGWAARHASSRVRLLAELERKEQELALARAELRLKDARMARVPGQARPHYAPVERLEIVELRALQGWSLQQTADRFLLSPVTVSSWMRRLDEQGPAALVQPAVPLNKYPDFVTHVVQQLKLKCPMLGYGKIAHCLCREGLHLGTSTVSRMLRRAAPPVPEPVREKRHRPVERIVADHPHHAWHCDLTTVPTSMGMWTSTIPFWHRLRWPFCWWLVVLADQFSARILKIAVFRRQPTSRELRAVVERAAEEAGVFPEHVITDMGQPFRRRGFRGWCRRMGARPLFGRLGQHGSLPFIERVVLTIKRECTTRMTVPFGERAMRREVELYASWYNGTRPHERLRGATPDEVCRGATPASTRARFEPRPGWPVDARHDARRVGGIAVDVRYLGGRRHLPIVTLTCVA